MEAPGFPRLLLLLGRWRPSPTLDIRVQLPPGAEVSTRSRLSSQAKLGICGFYPATTEMCVQHLH